MDITINHISLRAKSSLNTSSDTCAICRENVCDGCIKCQQANEATSQNTQMKKCFSVIGVCGHTYHYCCIQNCLTTQSYNGKKCPMCNKTWEMKKRSVQPTETKFKKIVNDKKNWNQQSHQQHQPHQPNQNNVELLMSDDDSDSGTDEDDDN